MALPRGRRRPAPDRQLLGRDGGRRRDRRLQPDHARSSRPASTGRARARRRTSSDRRGRSAPRRRRRARDPGAGAGHDPRLLARPASATSRRTGAAFPGRWLHGDWAIVDEDGHWFIRGRSDDTLKVAGKRVGPAEVEAAATAHPAVVEAAAIGVPHAVKGETIVVVCTLRRGETDDADLRAAISRRVVEDLGKTLKPEAVAVVPALPKTRSGQDHATRRAGGLAGPRPGRPVRARRPDDDRGDPAGRAQRSGGRRRMMAGHEAG